MIGYDGTMEHKTKIEMAWRFSTEQKPSFVGLTILTAKTMTAHEVDQVGSVVQEIEILIKRALGEEDE